MTKILRKSDGRRIFTDRFKREQVDRMRSGGVTVAELSRELGIARSLLQRWKRIVPHGAEIAKAPRRRTVPATDSRAVHYIRELELLVGKQTVELEHLRVELDAIKKRRR